MLQLVLEDGWVGAGIGTVFQHVLCENVNTTWLHPGGSAPSIKTGVLSLACGQHELDHTGFLSEGRDFRLLAQRRPSANT